MKYSTKITGWGEDALDFLADPENGFIIIFNENAPEELKEIAVLHTAERLGDDPAIGDTVIICEKVYEITAVGDEALHTLRELGHCTLCFRGDSEPERPGCIMLEGDPLLAEDVVTGATIEIY